MTTWMRSAALVAIGVMSVAPAVAEILVKFDVDAGALPEGVTVDNAVAQVHPDNAWYFDWPDINATEGTVQCVPVRNFCFSKTPFIE